MGSLVGVVLTAVLAGLGALLLAAWPWRPAAATAATGGLLLLGALLADPTGGWRGGWAGGAAAAAVLWGGLAVLALTVRGAAVERRWCRVAAAAAAATAAVLGVLLRATVAWPGDTFMAGGLVPAALLAAAGGALLAAAVLARDWPEERIDGGRLVAVAGWLLVVAAASRLVATATALAGPLPTLESRRVAVVALSVLWGGAGLALVLAGLARRAGHLRALGLGLLVVTAAKVFLWDLAAAATVIRVVAFLATGAALVAGSYLYARFRDYLEVRS